MHKQAGRRLPARETFFVISIINNSGRKKPRQRTKKMEAFVTTGLVLKETRYKDSDRILTILTPELGVISAAAQSSLRLKSKLFSACGLFCYSEFTLVPGRNMYTVREAEVKNVFHGISSSIEGMSLAMYMAEMAMTLSPTGQEAQRELRLLLAATEDPEEIWRCKRRIAELTPMLTQMNELAELTAHYYDRGYYRNEKYTV